MFNVLKASALILAGGASERIGGVKALKELNGKPLITYVIEFAEKLFEEILVVVGAHGQTEEFRSVIPEKVKVVEDSISNGGPLVGIMSGVNQISLEYTAVLPCDSPFMNVEVTKLLYRRCLGFDASIPRWPNGYIEPLHAFYRVQAIKPAGMSALEAGERRVADMIKRLNKVWYVDIDEVRRLDPHLLSFFNINRVEDLQKAERILEGLPRD